MSEAFKELNRLIHHQNLAKSRREHTFGEKKESAHGRQETALELFRAQLDLHPRHREALLGYSECQQELFSRVLGGCQTCFDGNGQVTGGFRSWATLMRPSPREPEPSEGTSDHPRP